MQNDHKYHNLFFMYVWRNHFWINLFINHSMTDILNILREFYSYDEMRRLKKKEKSLLNTVLDGKNDSLLATSWANGISLSWNRHSSTSPSILLLRKTTKLDRKRKEDEVRRLMFSQ